MKSTWWSTPALLVWGLGNSGQQPKSNLTLLASIETKKVVYGEVQVLRVVIKNTGQTPVLLVLPGEGSDYGFRTPFVAISTITEEPEKLVPVSGDKPAIHPANPPIEHKMARCGNVKGLRLSEIFTVGPGDSRLIYEEALPKYGPEKYRYLAYYINDPAIRWGGGPPHGEPEALELLKKTAKCSLRSNEVRWDPLGYARGTFVIR